MGRNIVLLFPGQGSQYVKMDQVAKDVLGNDYVQKQWESINDKLQINLHGFVKDGPLEQLTLTQHAQPSLVVTSILMLEAFYKIIDSIENKNFSITHVLGHSLGEFSALVAAGVMSLSDAAYITFLRGKFMQEAVAPGVGAMVALLKCPLNSIELACHEASDEKLKVSIANYNSPEQVVISGHSEAVSKAVSLLEKNVTQRFRSIPLQVSAPFHSCLMKPAELALSPYIDSIAMKTNEISYISNVDAMINPPHTSTLSIKEKLKKQICHAVEWVKSIEHFSEDTLFIEVGPGSVLSGLCKKIIPACKIYTMDKTDSASELRHFLAQS